MGSILSEVVLQQAWSAHPWPAVRLAEITEWAASDEYRRLLTGEYDTVLAEKRRARTPEASGPGDSLIGRASSLAKGVGERIGGLFHRDPGRPPPVEPTDG